MTTVCVCFCAQFTCRKRKKVFHQLFQHCKLLFGGKNFGSDSSSTKSMSAPNQFDIMSLSLCINCFLFVFVPSNKVIMMVLLPFQHWPRERFTKTNKMKNDKKTTEEAKKFTHIWFNMFAENYDLISLPLS